ncbi:hypothetical protein [Sphingomonas adhaesiva]|uniref:hypothetical protein n=1 Tax=Sphingomonas adhaesiva TaxID=28212 RepID=UPI0035C68E7A
MTDEHQRLVSVESQSEYNITSGKAETRIFVKMYVDAVKKGLIADIGAAQREEGMGSRGGAEAQSGFS